MFPKKLTRREFLEYSLAAAATLMLGCSQKTPVSETETKVESSFSENQDYFEWYPGVPKVTGENFDMILHTPELSQRYPRWDYGKKVYEMAEKLVKTFAKDRGIDLEERVRYMKRKDWFLLSALVVSGRPDIPEPLFLLPSFLSLSEVRASLYYLIDHNLPRDHENISPSMGNKIHYPFFGMLAECTNMGTTLAEILKNDEDYIRALFYSRKLTPETAEEKLKEEKFFLPALDPRKFKENEDVEYHTVKLLEKEGFSDKTIKTWLEDWADLGKRNKLEGFLLWPEDFGPTDKEPGRYRETLVITDAVIKKILKEYPEYEELGMQYHLNRISEFLLYVMRVGAASQFLLPRNYL